MLTAIELENFKAFGERQRLEIRPITLLYGKNSSGKSSCIRALQLLGQTSRNASSPREVVLSGPKADVDLGSFFELVHRHRPGAQSSLSIESTVFDDRTRCDIHFGGDGEGNAASLADLTISIGGLQRQWHKVISLVDGDADNGAESATQPGRGRTCEALALVDNIAPEAVEVMKEKLRLLLKNARPALRVTTGRDRRQSNLMDQNERTRREMWDQHMPSIADQCADKAGSLWTELAKLTLSLKHQSALSGRFAAYSYLWNEMSGDVNLAWVDALVPDHMRKDVIRRIRAELHKWIWRPRAAMAALMREISTLQHVPALRDAPRRMIPVDRDMTQIHRECQTVTEFLPRFGVECELRAEEFRTEQGRLVGYEFRLVPPGKHSDSGESWVDVGVGVSQVVPVILKCVDGGALTCVEQPELHLHPAAQASLADLFVEMAFSRNQDDVPDEEHPYDASQQPRFVPRQFIVETHSEHLVLRLRQLVRQGAIAPESVSLNVIETEDGEARIRRVDLDERGRFLNPWPGGFFPERDALL